MTDTRFKDELQLAARIVQSWPAWKQTSLQVTAMATTPAPRPPQNDSNSPQRGQGVQELAVEPGQEQESDH